MKTDYEIYCGKRKLLLNEPKVMGILNITPDSFYDGGCYQHLDAAIKYAESMCAAGASIIDVGGISTRPGASPVPVQQEMDRVLPVIEYLFNRLDVIISVDTSAPEVITEAVSLGAGMINDIRALMRPGALQAVQKTKVAICLMHMQGQPDTMQDNPEYQDVVLEVYEFLRQRVLTCKEAGISSKRILVDPGFGFGKTAQHNYALLRKINIFNQMDLPVLVGISRKSMLAAVTKAKVSDRLSASIALLAYAALNGARIFRVHDVPASVQALQVLQAVKNSFEENHDDSKEDEQLFLSEQ